MIYCKLICLVVSNFLFSIIYGLSSFHWLIFFKMVNTTNQLMLSHIAALDCQRRARTFFGWVHNMGLGENIRLDTPLDMAGWYLAGWFCDMMMGKNGFPQTCSAKIQRHARIHLQNFKYMLYISPRILIYDIIWPWFDYGTIWLFNIAMENHHF